MRKYYDEDELLEAKADEKSVTYFIVYRTWNTKYFNGIPSDGLVMSMIPTSYKTIKLAVKNKEKFANIPMIANSLDKIEIYEVPSKLELTLGDYRSMKHYERDTLLTKCELVYEEDLRDKNEEYERGYRAGIKAVLTLDEENLGNENKIKGIIKELKILQNKLDDLIDELDGLGFNREDVDDLIVALTKLRAGRIKLDSKL